MSQRLNGILGIGGAMMAVMLLALPALRPRPVSALAAGDVARSGALEMTAYAAQGAHGAYAVEVFLSNADPIQSQTLRLSEFQAETDRGAALANLSSRARLVLQPGESTQLVLAFAGDQANFLRVSMPKAALPGLRIGSQTRSLLLPVAKVDASWAVCREDTNCVP